MISLQTLGAFPTRDQIRSKLLSYFQAAEVPITDWEPGAVMRTLLELTAIGILDVGGSAIPTIVGGGFPEISSPASPDWIALLAEQWFGVTRTGATTTRQTVVLTCDASHGPFTISAGSLMVYSPTSGNRYRAITGGTLSTSSTLTITVQAESPNDSQGSLNYVDPAGTLTRLVTPMAGVTCNNPAPNFSAVSTTPSPASGLGVVTVSGTAPSSPTSYDVMISLGGQVSAAKIQTRVNGGAWTAPAIMAATFVFSGGPTVSFTNDPGLTTPSFALGDIYSFTSPGSPITVPGLDIESITALLARCFAKFPSLSNIAAPEKRFLWAKAANPLVVRARAFASTTHPGRCDLYIAGVTSTPLSGAIVTAVQLYITQHEAVTDRTTVSAAAVQTITASGSVTITGSQLQQDAVKAAAAATWAAYVVGTDIGGIDRLAELEQALMDAGAIDVGLPAGGALSLSGGAPNIQLTVGYVATPADITTTLTWKVI